tara:strand:+ start:316 stop:699 length:384 start_codon:yes stop_codon:yes gene_type:complete
MPRGKQGGKRQGTPGKGYSNRTDLGMNYAPANGAESPASGGIEPPKQQKQEKPMIYADDFPNLKDPTNRPAIPVSQGLPSGPGAGPKDQRREDAQQIKKWLPLLEPIANDPDTPNSVRSFVNFLKSV